MQPTSQQVVDGLFAIVVAASPIALRYIPWAGLHKAALSAAIAIVIALIATLTTGQFAKLDVSSIQTWLVMAGWMWALQQGVFRVLVTTVPESVRAPVRAKTASR